MGRSNLVPRVFLRPLPLVGRRKTLGTRLEILQQLTGSSKESKIRVVFATVAIGIGVNIPEVRHVIHLEVSRTLELYHQELGRAGRDGKHAKASLYYNGTDIASNKAGMTDEMRRYCTLSGQCLSLIFSIILVHSQFHSLPPYNTVAPIVVIVLLVKGKTDF